MNEMSQLFYQTQEIFYKLNIELYLRESENGCVMSVYPHNSASSKEYSIPFEYNTPEKIYLFVRNSYPEIFL